MILKKSLWVSLFFLSKPLTLLKLEQCFTCSKPLRWVSVSNQENPLFVLCVLKWMLYQQSFDKFSVPKTGWWILSKWKEFLLCDAPIPCHPEIQKKTNMNEFVFEPLLIKNI